MELALNIGVERRFDMDSISKLKLNFIYNTSYQILKMLVPLVTTPYIARVLGPEGTGVYSYANSIAAYFVMFAMLGVNNYGNRSIAMVRDNNKKLSEKFWSIYFLQLITSSIVVVVYILYLCTVCDDKRMGWILLMYVLSSALDINWFFAGLEKFKLIVVRNMFIQILTVILIFVFVKKADDVYIYGLIYAIGSIIQQAILWRYVHEKVTRVRVHWSDIVVHIKPVMILFIPLLAVSLYKVMDKIMLGWMSIKREVGYYEACERICALPSGVIVSLGSVMLPRMANLFAKKEEDKSREYIYKSIMLAMFFSSAICFGLMAVSNEFVPLYYGVGYEKCILLFKILLPSSIFVSFANVIRTQYLIPREQDITYIISVSLGALVNIVLNILLIPQMQSIGAAIGTLVAEMAVCLYQSIAVYRKLEIKKYLIETMPFIITGILMYGVVRSVQLQVENILFVLGAKICIGAIFYLGITASITIVRKYMKNRLR